MAAFKAKVVSQDIIRSIMEINDKGVSYQKKRNMIYYNLASEVNGTKSNNKKSWKKDENLQIVQLYVTNCELNKAKNGT